jgi:hypothetical protein
MGIYGGKFYEKIVKTRLVKPWHKPKKGVAQKATFINFQ